jgi:hypothetical protein
MVIVTVSAVAWCRGAVADRVWLDTETQGPRRVHPLVLLYPLRGSAMMSARLRIPKS